MATRRTFIKTISLGGLAIYYPQLLLGNNSNKPDFELIDYHVHLSRNLSLERAVNRSRELQIKFGLVPHPAPRYGSIDNDIKLTEYITNTKAAGLFAGLQPVDPGWYRMFSNEAINKLDYVLMDALEIPNKNGGYEIIHRDDYKLTKNTNAFMKDYLDFYEQVIRNEKINILANPTFLPTQLKADYRAIWTQKRMLRVINAAIESDVAIEINSIYRIPDANFVALAKSGGAKFSFGTNGRSPAVVGDLKYCLEFAEACHLKKEDLYSLQ